MVIPSLLLPASVRSAASCGCVPTNRFGLGLTRGPPVDRNPKRAPARFEVEAHSASGADSLRAPVAPEPRRGGRRIFRAADRSFVAFVWLAGRTDGLDLNILARVWKSRNIQRVRKTHPPHDLPPVVPPTSELGNRVEGCAPRA